MSRPNGPCGRNVTSERPASPRPERKPGEAGLRAGELMCRGGREASPRRTIDDTREPNS
jgi:hypothetical protein